MIESFYFTSDDCDLEEVNITLVFNPESWTVIPRVNLVVTPTLITGHTPDRSIRVTFEFVRALGETTFLTLAIDPNVGYGQKSFFKMTYSRDQFLQLGLRVKRGLENSGRITWEDGGMEH